LRVRDLDKVADYYRDAIGLTVMQRSAYQRASRLGRRGAARPRTARRRGARGAQPAGLYHTAFLMPTRKDLARWLVHAAKNKVPLPDSPTTSSANPSISTTPKATA
jgi:catechol 2,3-dioxygenase